ncbi:hypothetical protein L13192_06963 [Pyrenophora tritici-repentis]|uniref:Tail specific protease domain-containing protein n=1 Tax=Pyrenophora tritici-repentis TaxID=45151 RepID=A0A922NAD9_9PLEO|nr:hypothetical protein Ptr86124_009361 [Pyrenophora tritici-repentis]KAI1669504.1 hypothetical protein L13192_06963 [Pyrenophora tritici-repentis]KAI1683598.1 hypothetical protein KJE20_06103 [Pyrenophora tritici-repentis]
MKTSVVFSALLGVVTAQTNSAASETPIPSLNLEPTPAPTPTADDTDIKPSTIAAVSGPIKTSEACGNIAAYVVDSTDKYPAVEAELAYACLKSLPFNSEDASTTLDEIKKMVQFQSTLSYLKDPPKGWPNEPVDIMAGLEDIRVKVESPTYTNEYDFEADIAALLVKAHDGHLAWNGMVYAAAFLWRRSSDFALISASKDGSEIPRIWAMQDFNGTTSYEPSPVTKVDGRDVVEFLNEEAKLSAYHDPDTRFNAMFFMQPAENFGYFTSPRFYPGANTNVTYENGTTNTYRNGAIVLRPDIWSSINSPETFYETYVLANSSTTSSLGVKRRDVNAPPLNLENPRDYELHGALGHDYGAVPVLYPDPVVAHSADKVPLAGYFIDTSVGKIGVLVIQTFLTEDVSAAREFQRVIQEYISQAQARGVEKHIIDVRTNGGGKILSGYDAYRQFFPSQVPQTQSRYRGHRASEIFGENISSFETLSLTNGILFTSVFSNDAYLSASLEPFKDWKAMYPPKRFKNDNFTSLLKFNLSDPLITSDPQLGVGITITGYNERSNFTQDPFRAEDIILLTDGICASTCSIFTELMTQQSNVRTLAVGGRPQLGPMVAVGGTKGTLVLQDLYMHALSTYITLAFADSVGQALTWRDVLPFPAPIASLEASVNFQDNIRKGMEGAGVPTQFLNDTASARIWYQPGDFFNVTKLWERVAGVAWGKDGGLDEGAVVRGSMTGREQQTGRGEANPGSESDGGGKEDEEDAAVGLRAGWVWTVVCAVVAVSLVW